MEKDVHISGSEGEKAEERDDFDLCISSKASIKADILGRYDIFSPSQLQEEKNPRRSHHSSNQSSPIPCNISLKRQIPPPPFPLSPSKSPHDPNGQNPAAHYAIQSVLSISPPSSTPKSKAKQSKAPRNHTSSSSEKRCHTYFPRFPRARDSALTSRVL